MFKTASASVAGFAASRDARGRTASRVKVGSFEYEPAGPDYLYVSLRALSADRPNLNFDMFPSDELREAHGTFVGSSVFLEHDNRDPEKSRGAIIASRFHDEDPDDKWVEILMELDERRCPKLCSMIRSGEIDTFSMGCNVEFSECPICGAKAEQPWQFCEHMRNKGVEYGGEPAYGVCHGIEFFEESVVYNPADPTARAIEVAGDRGDVAERTGEWFDELGTWVLEDPDGITLTADDNGFWFALDGGMNEICHGECRDKESAKREAESWMRNRKTTKGSARTAGTARAASRTAWKSRDLSQTDELRRLRWRPTNSPVATGANEPLCWYPVHGIDSICADYGRGFVCCRAYEAVSGRTNITVDYVELESPSSLVATGRSVSIGVLHCNGFDPTGAEFLEAAKRADAWAKSNEGIGYAFSSRKSSGKVAWDVLNDETVSGEMNGVDFLAELVEYGMGGDPDEWEMRAYILESTYPYEDALWDSRFDSDDGIASFEMRGIDFSILDEHALDLYDIAVMGMGGTPRRTAQTADGWSQTDNGDGTTTYTNGTDTATVSPHESGQGYGYEVKDQDGNVKGYGWAQTADEAAQKAKDSEQQVTASRTAGYKQLAMTLRDEANGTVGELSDGSDVLFSNVVDGVRGDSWWWSCSDGYYMTGFASLEDAIDDFCEDYGIEGVLDGDVAPDAGHEASNRQASPSTVACTLGDGTTVTLVSEPERDDIYVDIFNGGRYTSRVVATPESAEDVMDAITEMSYDAYPRVLDIELLDDDDWHVIRDLCEQAIDAMAQR